MRTLGVGSVVAATAAGWRLARPSSTAAPARAEVGRRIMKQLSRVVSGVAFALLATSSRPALGGVLLDHSFAGGIPPYWVQWTRGTGQVTLTPDAARFIIFDTSSSCCYSDAEIDDLMGRPAPWHYVNVDFRLRASNTNQYQGGTGVGSRGWGFWNGS